MFQEPPLSSTRAAGKKEPPYNMIITRYEKCRMFGCKCIILRNWSDLPSRICSSLKSPTIPFELLKAKLSWIMVNERFSALLNKLGFNETWDPWIKYLSNLDWNNGYWLDTLSSSSFFSSSSSCALSFLTVFSLILATWSQGALNWSIKKLMGEFDLRGYPSSTQQIATHHGFELRGGKRFAFENPCI